MESIVQKLRNLDAYPKINEDFFSRTLSGGVITLFSSLIMLFLFLSEFWLFLHTVKDTKLVVDTSRGETLRISFDVTFPVIPCSLLSLDAVDISGEQHLDIRHDIVKKRIDGHGNLIQAKQDGIGAPKIEKPLQRHGGRLEHNEKYCGSCFGAETSDDDCCNSCEEVREAYRKKGWALTNADLVDQCKREGFVQNIKDEEGEGCNIEGSLEVNKVAGNFHFMPGKSFHQAYIHLFDLLDLQTHYYNVVPTLYTNIRGHKVHSNQYSVTEHFKSAEVGHLRSLPGVFFYYDFSPIKVGSSYNFIIIIIIIMIVIVIIIIIIGSENHIKQMNTIQKF
ncbi:hypothetical protein L484_017219 [Morus notabilis]|uniref:Endoplasmic reticulum-Golgi intermediate compartment protein 3 n=1 Tax=Morus notabilis TaxID=981085 RepID=W9QVH1_9ROSA|nr:hypothetical protein L484_017219 [Morus notabilis]